MAFPTAVNDQITDSITMQRSLLQQLIQQNQTILACNIRLIDVLSKSINIIYDDKKANSQNLI